MPTSAIKEIAIIAILGLLSFTVAFLWPKKHLPESETITEICCFSFSLSGAAFMSAVAAEYKSLTWAAEALFLLWLIWHHIKRTKQENNRQDKTTQPKPLD